MSAISLIVHQLASQHFLSRNKSEVLYFSDMGFVQRSYLV